MLPTATYYNFKTASAIILASCVLLTENWNISDLDGIIASIAAKLRALGTHN